MAYPDRYTRGYGFASYQESHPQSPLPGSQVDVELDAAGKSTAAITAFLQKFARSDGRLANGSVGVDQLAPDLTIGFKAPTTWEPSVLYSLGATVFYLSGFYNCTTAHTSGSSFNPDYWDLILDFGSSANAAAASAAVAVASETAAGVSETNAAASETNAESAAGTATTQAGIATTQAVAAAASAATATVTGANLFGRGPVISILGTPPGSPTDGNRYLVAHSGTTGAWVGKEDQVVERVSGAWVYSGAPSTNQTLQVISDGYARRWSGTAWSKDSATVESFLSGETNGVPRSVGSKLQDWVSILDFGVNTTPGTTDMTAALTAALATGKSVFVPHGQYKITSSVTVSVWQRLVGVGFGSELQFSLGSDGTGLIVLERAEVHNIYVHGLAHTTKLVSVQGPQASLIASRFAEDPATGTAIYVEDENTGSGLYTFGLVIDRCWISSTRVSGNTGVRFGLNAQTARITNSWVIDCGVHVVIANACSNMVFTGNTFEGSADYSVLFGGGGHTTALAAAIVFSGNYFEENLIVFRAADLLYGSVLISDNFAYRNTASITGSAFFSSVTGASAQSTGIRVERNYIQAFDYAFNLAGEYASQLTSTRGNRLDSCTGFATGTYADNAFKIKTFNSYYSRRLISGTFAAESRLNLQGKNFSFEIPLELDSRFYIEKITFRYVQGSGTGVTATLHAINSTDGSTDTSVASASASTNGTQTITVGANVDPACNYAIRVDVDDAGTEGDVYPFRVFLREQ